MENKTISYTFFTPKHLYEHRFWDETNNFERYWYNIPALMAINNILYPDFDIKIYYASDLKEDDKFLLLKQLSEKFNISLEERTEEYNHTEPTIWRYKPIFDKTHDIVLCRDVDSLPTKMEYLSTQYFIENKQFKIHTLRTHTNHATGATIILAGLCGFRPKDIPFIKTIDYDLYHKSIYNNPWGLDQNSLISIFTRDRNWTRTRFMDSKISTNMHIVGGPVIPCVSHDENFYGKLDYDKNLDGLLNLLDEFTTWSGQPTDIRKEKLEKLLSLDFDQFKIIRELIEGNEKFKEFYL